MIEVAGVILPKLDLIHMAVVKEAFSVHFRVCNAFARPIVAAGFHATFKRRARLLVDCLGIISLRRGKHRRKHIENCDVPESE